MKYTVGFVSILTTKHHPVYEIATSCVHSHPYYQSFCPLLLICQHLDLRRCSPAAGAKSSTDHHKARTAGPKPSQAKPKPMMDLVDRLLDYVATVPASESVDEVRTSSAPTRTATCAPPACTWTCRCRAGSTRRAASSPRSLTTGRARRCSPAQNCRRPRPQTLPALKRRLNRPLPRQTHLQHQ